MPGNFLNQGSTVMCMHAGSSTPAVVNPRVKTSSQPIPTLTSMYTVAGCPFPPPPAGIGPCVTSQPVKGGMRVTAMKVPVLLQDQVAVSVPTATGLNVILPDLRVKGQ